MNEIVAAIVEDEIPAARLLKSMLEELRPNWKVITLPGSNEEAIEWFYSHPHPDILFLDIHLTDGNSFFLVDHARPESLIVFTTAYDEYALKAFSVNSVDYLLKPISKDRLLEAIQKMERISTRFQDMSIQHEQIKDLLYRLKSQDKKLYRSRFLVSAGNKLFSLRMEDIAYFYSENKVTFAVNKEGKESVIDQPLDKLMLQLDPDVFYRANRQVILSVSSIKRVEPYYYNKVIVYVNPPFKEPITVSKEKVSEFKLWLNY